MPPRDRLTVKEKTVALLVWEGHTNREIAARINTSEQVVKNHLRSAFDKLGVWSRLELALYVASHGGANWEGGISVIPLQSEVQQGTNHGAELGLERGNERVNEPSLARGMAQR